MKYFLLSVQNIQPQLFTCGGKRIGAGIALEQ
jgi:hypothetical protein